MSVIQCSTVLHKQNFHRFWYGWLYVLWYRFLSLKLCQCVYFWFGYEKCSCLQLTSSFGLNWIKSIWCKQSLPKLHDVCCYVFFITNHDTDIYLDTQGSSNVQTIDIVCIWHILIFWYHTFFGFGGLLKENTYIAQKPLCIHFSACACVMHESLLYLFLFHNSKAFQWPIVSDFMMSLYFWVQNFMAFA